MLYEVADDILQDAQGEDPTTQFGITEIIMVMELIIKTYDCLHNSGILTSYTSPNIIQRTKLLFLLTRNLEYKKVKPYYNAILRAGTKATPESVREILQDVGIGDKGAIKLDNQ